MKILLIDDDQQVLRSSQRIITHLGHQLIGSFTSGKEALQGIYDGNLQPDIVLTDNDFGEEKAGDEFKLNGLLLAEKLSEYPNMKVVMVSGGAEPDPGRKASRPS